MGVYVVTGGSGGIGGKTVEILRSQGHEVVNVDLKDSDICANLATKEGRDEVIHTIHAQYPDGIDGLCCNAGVSGACGNLKLMISLNYFGATNLAHGLFDLLKKKGGSCVVTSSNTISQGAARMDLVDMLNYSQICPGPVGPPGLRLLGRQRRADQHRGPRQCLHPHDRHHERKRQGRPGRLAHPHQLRHRYPDGPGGHRQRHRLLGLSPGPWDQRQCPVRRRRHRRASQL